MYETGTCPNKVEKAEMCSREDTNRFTVNLELQPAAPTVGNHYKDKDSSDEHYLL
jgi:hypothetical protein